VETSTGIVTTLVRSQDLVGPNGVAAEGVNLYVTDMTFHVVRKVAIATGDISTLAGTMGVVGSADGAGSEAQFSNLWGITTDSTNLYVADAQNYTVRKIVIATGVVTTLAGKAGAGGEIDGTGSAARLNPVGIATDGTSVYICSAFTIRRITIATGAVKTLAGSGVWTGSADGTGSDARFNCPKGILYARNSLFVADTYSNTIRQIK
jgi:hypothetical protein